MKSKLLSQHLCSEGFSAQLELEITVELTNRNIFLVG